MSWLTTSPFNITHLIFHKRNPVYNPKVQACELALLQFCNQRTVQRLYKTRRRFGLYMWPSLSSQLDGLYPRYLGSNFWSLKYCRIKGMNLLYALKLDCVLCLRGPSTLFNYEQQCFLNVKRHHHIPLQDFHLFHVPLPLASHTYVTNILTNVHILLK